MAERNKLIKEIRITTISHMVDWKFDDENIPP